MRQSLEQLNPLFEGEYDVRLDLRVGVATGEAVAAAGDAEQFMVTGEVPNLAARLQSAGGGAGVVVSGRPTGSSVRSLMPSPYGSSRSKASRNPSRPIV